MSNHRKPSASYVAMYPENSFKIRYLLGNTTRVMLIAI